MNINTNINGNLLLLNFEDISKYEVIEKINREVKLANHL